MKLINGDSKIELKKIEDESIDFVCTDPPYGLKFMGKNWDKTLPDKEIFKECLRVLKPGAFMCCMSAPRTDLYWRMCQMIEEVGFKVDFTPIIWAYASGFPKAYNIAKGISAKDITGNFNTKALRLIRLKDKYKPTGQVDSRKGRMFGNIESDNEITELSETAKKFEGSYGGFQPKPAVEMIIVAMKPLSEKTYVAQALKNGKGITWLDDCRIPYEKPYKPHLRGTINSTSTERKWGYKECGIIGSEKGRFPANLIVSDNAIDIGKITKSRVNEPNWERSNSKIQIFSSLGSIHKSGRHYNDEGNFSRFFDIDKWYEVQFAIFSKANKNEKNKGCENLGLKKGGALKGTEDLSLKTGSGNIRNNMYYNNHPTVKPVKLMTYLITMFSREGDIILDPFMGSGTTGVACVQTKRDFLGIELIEDYYKIAKARIDNELKIIENTLFNDI